MGRKGGKYRKKDNNTAKKKLGHYDSDDDMMNDEIDAFHKQRDIVPLDVNEDEAESDEDIEQPVFDFEDDKNDKGDDADDDDDLVEDDSQLTGRAAKIARQQKYLRAKIGGVEEEMHEDDDEGEEEGAVWGRSKSIYYNADNSDYEIQSSDEELPAEEEAEVLRLQKEKAKSLKAEDFGLDDVSESETDKEPTFEEILVHGKPVLKANLGKEAKDDTTTVYEEVKKDLNDLTREEQMDVVYSSAPELVGLLSELGDTLEQLENKVNPLLNKLRDGDKATKGGIYYMEMKQQLLLSYCQAITFYLLLKSEGQPIRDHPVISRLVEIKNLLDKMRELDENLPPQLEDILLKNESAERVEKQVKEYATIKSFSRSEVHQSSVVPVKISEKSEALEGSQVVDENSLKGCKDNKSNFKQQDTEVGKQSMQMLKVRAALEEKLRQKGIFTSTEKRNEGARKRLRPVNGQLETLDDFDDDALDLQKDNHRTDIRNRSLLHARKLSKLVTQGNKPKVSGDDDLPKRDDIGERRRKHELRVLAGAGIKSVDDVDDVPGTLPGEGDSGIGLDDGTESDIEFYNQVEQENAAKLAAKSQIYSRSTKAPPLPETLVDGKRQISYQIEKNRGLTRARKKLTKNPRKKYKLKHQKAVVRRKGQVREIRKPTSSYGGETSGINAAISRSMRFKS